MIVAGGGPAGMSAAARAHRVDPSLEILAFEAGAYTSYAAAGLPYVVSGAVDTVDDLVVRTPAQHRARGIDVHERCRVTGIDLDARTVSVVDQARGTTDTYGFDHLVLATGASAIRPALPGMDAAGVFTIDSIPDAAAIDRAVGEARTHRAVVVGAGYTGLEMVEVLTERGLEVTLVEQGDRPMVRLDADLGARITDAIHARGVTTRFATAVTGFAADGDGRLRAVETTTGPIPAELVVLCVGVRPNVGFAAEAGITIGTTGAIATDARRRTGVSGVWAVGDCSESLHRVSQRPVWVGLGTHANKHGRVAGTNIAGGSARFEGVLGSAITLFGDTEIACTGLNASDAAVAGFAVATTVVEGATLPDYFPGSAAMTVKLVTDRSNGRLLGAQIVGGPGSGKRIDALAVAVWNEMTVGDYAQLDLSYSPPFAPVWETSLIAARLAGG